jgi:uncharacterized protein
MPKPPGFEWDQAKAAINWRKHRVSFAAVEHFDFSTALELEGADRETEEVRTALLGKLRRETCVLVFTRRTGKLRVISLRRATAKERQVYIEAKNY